MSDSKPNRRRFQFHLNTAVFAMLLAGITVGVIIWATRIVIPEVPESLKRMENADAILDAGEAIKHHDYRFIGIYGEGLFTPSAPLPLVNKYGVNPIKGTSDFQIGTDAIRLQRKAVDYAERYNRIVLDFINRLEAKTVPNSYESSSIPSK